MEDTVAHITVAVLNIPQGTAYSILGNVELTVGVYTWTCSRCTYSSLLVCQERHVTCRWVCYIRVVPDDWQSGGHWPRTRLTALRPVTYSQAIWTATTVTMVADLVQLSM